MSHSPRFELFRMETLVPPEAIAGGFQGHSFTKKLDLYSHIEARRDPWRTEGRLEVEPLPPGIYVRVRVHLTQGGTIARLGCMYISIAMRRDESGFWHMDYGLLANNSRKPDTAPRLRDLRWVAESPRKEVRESREDSSSGPKGDPESENIYGIKSFRLKDYGDPDQ